VSSSMVVSIGLDSVDEIFSTVGKKLGQRLKRVADGEIGSRRLWARFQCPPLRSSPFLRPDPAEIYLGLGPVHADASIEGALAPIKTSREFVPHFGIATECGIARARTPETVHCVLDTCIGASRNPS
jgi:hypothetical protein